MCFRQESGNGNYDTRLLYGQVKKLPFRDHNICKLRSLVSFCEHATEFLNESDENVVAIHCQASDDLTAAA